MVSLFEPVQLGAVTLHNRIVMSPLTRARASDRIPNDLMRQYYCQRASAGLVIAEATSVSPQGVGYLNTPGIWSRSHVDGWRKITKAVHKKGGKIFLQLWHVGRVSDPEFLSGQMPVAPSAIACPGNIDLPYLQRPYVRPRAMNETEIRNVVADFADAAAKAMEAGFDGIDIHAANGYLIDQFLHDQSNKRQDQYGGSIENRCRLLLEIVDACMGVWGAERIGVHISPFNPAHAMIDSNPSALFSYVAQALGQRKIAFLFVREAPGREALTGALKLLFGGPVIVNQDYTLEKARQALDAGRADAVAFGRPFISNPDLVERFQTDTELTPWDASTFYEGGPTGYIDYPCVKMPCFETADSH